MDFSDYRDELDTKTSKERFFAGIPKVKAKATDKMEIYQLFLQHIITSLNAQARRQGGGGGTDRIYHRPGRHRQRHPRTLGQTQNAGRGGVDAEQHLRDHWHQYVDSVYRCQQ
ncbi:hypothetical protein SAMN05421863_1002120 [Nitrosomonas communis]|uniref:Uncharacterized protein n=1 Tax=Nitrosomonas communis TaxID=44574 RepID=A0A1I4JLY2_9PROT|nr:hypothetical protein [Nitrosomonas communis]SFL67615.1 hypothetical protein SAMN05421863_1002120 [Nitrosomonas communis]